MSEIPPTEIVLYATEDGETHIDVRTSGETVWLSLDQMAQLFQRDKSTISRHISNVFSEGELNREGTVADFATVHLEGSREVTRQVTYFNLDVIISVGYRVKSLRGTQFRIWATDRLREYLIKGFTMDDERLKNLGGGTYWKELLERIRDIRSSEKVLYRQILDLYATSVDYDKNSKESVKFFAIVKKSTHMLDWIKHPDRFVIAMEAPVRQGPGSVSHEEAQKKVEGEYEVPHPTRRRAIRGRGSLSGVHQEHPA